MITPSSVKSKRNNYFFCNTASWLLYLYFFSDVYRFRYLYILTFVSPMPVYFFSYWQRETVSISLPFLSHTTMIITHSWWLRVLLSWRKKKFLLQYSISSTKPVFSLWCISVLLPVDFLMFLSPIPTNFFSYWWGENVLVSLLFLSHDPLMSRHAW
jgi:hypothetical protein